MKSYVRFLKAHYALLAFGALFAFFSSFGQTFLISLFVPHFRDVFDLSSSLFGTIYSLATVTSAFILPWAGKQMDRISLQYFSICVAAGLVVATGLLSVTQGIATLFLGLTGIRLFGQALSMHTSQTSMARYFNENRGKALSIAGLGLPLGEAILPVSVAFLISLVGWRMGWGLMSVTTLLILLPGIILLLRLGGKQGDESAVNGGKGKPPKGIKGKQWSRGDALRNWRFYIVAPVGVTIPFMLTGLFLYQLQLAESKGWSVELMASGFVAFAISKSVFSLISGPIIDRISAQKLFPFVLLPLGAGVLFLNNFDWAGIVFVYLFFTGMSQGVEINVKNALYAELYGVAHIGAIRSLMSTLMVMSTAVSPALFGYLIDIDIPFTWILNGCLIMIAVNTILAMFIGFNVRKSG